MSSVMSSLLGAIGPVLEALILVRAWRGNFLKEFKFFYAYLFCVLLRDASLLAVYHVFPTWYAYVYWYSQFLVLLIGCGLIWEIYRIALAHYSGAARIARSVLLFLFIITMSRIIAYTTNNARWLPGQTTLETEREFRVVQSVVLVGLIALLAYYAIPIGRNLKGIIVGYGFFLTTSLVQLTLRDYIGGSFQVSWQYIQPVTYIIVLLIWCYALWSFEPRLRCESQSAIELDYEVLASATKRQLKSAGAYIAKVIRP
jgi:hypothetical protein